MIQSLNKFTRPFFYISSLVLTFKMDRIGYTGIYSRTFRKNYRLVLVNLVNILLDPVKTYSVYYYDITTDILQTYTLFANCHYYYPIISIELMLASYATTVFHLIRFLKLTPDRAVLYPYYHS